MIISRTESPHLAGSRQPLHLCTKAGGVILLLTLMEAVIPAVGSNVEEHFARAYGLQKERKFEDALTEYGRVIEADPHHYQSYVNLSFIHRQLGRYDKAIADLNRAIALRPDCADYFYHRACVFVLLKDYDRGLADLDRAIFARRNYADAYYVRGQIWQLNKEPVKALKDYRSFLKLAQNAEDPNVRQRVGEVRQKIEQMPAFK